MTSHCRVEKRIWHEPHRTGEYTCLYFDLEVEDTPEQGRELHQGRWFSGPLEFVVWNVDLERFNCRAADEAPSQDADYDYGHAFLVENALHEGWRLCGERPAS